MLPQILCMQTHINIKLFIAPYEFHAYTHTHVCMYTKCTYSNNPLLNSKDD